MDMTLLSILSAGVNFTDKDKIIKLQKEKQQMFKTFVANHISISRDILHPPHPWHFKVQISLLTFSIYKQYDN